MTISNQQKKRFRAIGHRLRPVVTIAGNGLSPAVVKEIERAIGDHELIKIKLVAGDRQERRSLLMEVNEILDSVTVQQIGNVALIYKAADEPDPSLSNLVR